MTSEQVLDLPVPAAALGSASGPEVARYAQDVTRRAAALRYPRLVRTMVASGPDVLLQHGHGLTTIGGMTKDLPAAWLRAVGTFRLGQYLQLAYASGEVAWRRALFAENPAHFGARDYHIATVDAEGAILGYVSFVHNGSPGGESLVGPGRGPLFPVEVAHGIDLFEIVGSQKATSANTREIKRFVHSRSLGDRALRLRVTIDLMRGLTESFVAGSGGPVSVVVGDTEERSALKHLLLAGLHVRSVVGTTPHLPEDDIMHGLYRAREVVDAFYAELPSRSCVHLISRTLKHVAMADDVFSAACRLATIPAGSVTKFTVPAVPLPVTMSEELAG